MSSARLVRLLAVALFVVTSLAAIAPVRNYDLFWHLATGRWIVEHTSLPETDPFAVASAQHAWINGEWLFQVAAYGLESAGGLALLSVARALFAGGLFALIFVLACRDSEPFLALLLTALAFAGASATLDFRPSSLAMLFVVIAIAARSTAAQAVNAVFWINVHPSALLAPAIAAMTTRKVLPVVITSLALLVNPYGWRAIAAPLELLSIVGEFVNAEWMASSPLVFPILYLLMLGGGAALVLRRAGWWRIVLFVGFTVLAARHVRHQPLFYAAFPLLVAPAFPGGFPAMRRGIAVVSSAAAILLVAFTGDHRLGVAPERFPLRAVAALRASGLEGNIYNPDQFGGLLIWSFYPERRTLTDGRNELHREYIAEYTRAREDQRAWRALLAKYRIDLAVDEMRPPLRTIDAATGQVRSIPASLAYWPRSDWALIAYDRAGMVFARRAAYPPEVLERFEVRGVVPDAVR